MTCAFMSHHPGGAHPGWTIILCVFIHINETFSILQIIKVSIFLDCCWLESPVSLSFIEPKLKPDRFGPIIWYQSLGGSFQLWFGRIYIRKPPETLIGGRSVYFGLLEISGEFI
ncbi:hypothetical protein HanRHA438_Chr09g0376931 [Helianthus annuus]|nr:hypothetical protein HanRHA438_Chr09g0376931 [Helianthus annuus]